jgi:hypothetical protein
MVVVVPRRRRCWWWGDRERRRRLAVGPTVRPAVPMGPFRDWDGGRKGKGGKERCAVGPFCLVGSCWPPHTAPPPPPLFPPHPCLPSVFFLKRPRAHTHNTDAPESTMALAGHDDDERPPPPPSHPHHSADYRTDRQTDRQTSEWSQSRQGRQRNHESTEGKEMRTWRPCMLTWMSRSTMRMSLFCSLTASRRCRICSSTST